VEEQGRGRRGLWAAGQTGAELIGNMTSQLLVETLSSLWFRFADSLQLSAQHLAYVGQCLQPLFGIATPCSFLTPHSGLAMKYCKMWICVLNGSLLHLLWRGMLPSVVVRGGNAGGWRQAGSRCVVGALR
jgi:hypothetical protein